MFFWGIVAVAAIGFAVWLVRSPLVRAHLRGHGSDPGEAGTRVDGKFPRNGGGYFYDGKPK
jgi:hypothetical protein